MARIRELGVWMDGARIATLTAPRVGQVRCEYSAQAQAGHPIGTPLLSCSLPVRPGSHDAWPFVDGLLPEGQHRASMAQLAGVPTHDLLGMLHHFGRDVAGALVVSSQDPATQGTPSAIPYAQGELETAVSELEEHPLGLFDDSELSVAGLQDKMLLVRLPSGDWARPVHGYPSTHILKVNDRTHTGLVRAEHAALRLARAAGIPAANSEVMQVGGVDVIIVERFDRITDAAGAAHRVHQEDSCQALGRRADAAMNRGKYQRYGGPSYREVAQLLIAHAADADEQLLRLLERMVFTAAIGDADAHGKNLALLHPTPSLIRLAPLYDTVPTGIWPTLRQDAAMAIGGGYHLRTLTGKHLQVEAASWGLNPQVVTAAVSGILTRLAHALADGGDAFGPIRTMVHANLQRLSTDT